MASPSIMMLMPVAFTDTVSEPTLDKFRKKWTREECELLIAAGIWNAEHLELIQGELIDKIGKHRPHVIAVALIYEWLIEVFGFRRVQKEDPIDVAPADNPASEPEPDLIVLRAPLTQFDRANPRPSDILLAIEVADTSLSFDLKTKAPLYARAGIPEYWVLDVNMLQMIVYREPEDGKYKSAVVYSAAEAVAPLAAPGQEFRVADAFPA